MTKHSKKLSGQEKAKQNLEAFEVWQAIHTDNDFVKMISRGQLNRRIVAENIGCGKSALDQNPALRAALRSLENRLRQKGILPPLASSIPVKNNNNLKASNKNSSQNSQDFKRLSALETENIELRAKLSELEKSLQRFGELSETLSEMGFIPR